MCYRVECRVVRMATRQAMNSLSSLLAKCERLHGRISGLKEAPDDANGVRTRTGLGSFRPHTGCQSLRLQFCKGFLQSVLGVRCVPLPVDDFRIVFVLAFIVDVLIAQY